MKLFLLILLPFFSLAQASTYEPGDSTWITSNDTSKVKVYKGNRPVRIVLDGLLSETLTQAYIDTLKAHGKTIHYTNGGSSEYVPPPKYDTIGPFWKQVSDTTAGYNSVMAMQLFEVRVYKNEWITVDPNIVSANGSTTLMATYPEQRAFPHHFAWLDIKKKPFKLKVWEGN